MARTLTLASILAPYSAWAERIGQYLPLEVSRVFLKLATREWLLLVGGHWPLCTQHQPFERLLSGYTQRLLLTQSGHSAKARILITSDYCR